MFISRRRRSGIGGGREVSAAVAPGHEGSLDFRPSARAALTLSIAGVGGDTEALSFDRSYVV
jgi:hypothetical protein